MPHNMPLYGTLVIMTGPFTFQLCKWHLWAQYFPFINYGTTILIRESYVTLATFTSVLVFLEVFINELRAGTRQTDGANLYCDMILEGGQHNNTYMLA